LLSESQERNQENRIWNFEAFDEIEHRVPFYYKENVSPCFVHEKGHPVFVPRALALFSKEITVSSSSGKCQNQKIIFYFVYQ
jgi:hypothetical protein